MASQKVKKILFWVVPILFLAVLILAISNRTSPQQLPACEKKKNPISKDKCYGDAAVRTLDSGMCSFVQQQQKKDDCYNAIAQVTRDESLCGKVTVADPDRDSCYNVIASQTGRTSLCWRIHKDSVRELCYASAPSEPGN